MNTERNSYTTVNEFGLLSIITLVLGLGLFFIISIETFVYNILKDSDVLNQESEWYDIINFLPHSLIALPYLFFPLFYVGRFVDSGSVSPSYHYPSFFGSKNFRRIMRILSSVHWLTFANSGGIEPGGVTNNFASGMVASHAMLFCLIMVLISRLIERDNKSIIHE